MGRAPNIGFSTNAVCIQTHRNCSRDCTLNCHDDVAIGRKTFVLKFIRTVASCTSIGEIGRLHSINGIAGSELQHVWVSERRLNWRDIGEYWRLIGDVGIGGISVSELTEFVGPPAGDGLVVEDCACVVSASGDGGGGASGAEVDGATGCAGVGVRSVSEFTGPIRSPAFDGVVVEDHARVRRSGGDCFSGASGAEVDGVAGCGGGGVCSVSELTGSIPSPAFDVVVVEDDA